MAVSESLIISIDKFRYYTNTEDTVDANFITPLIIQAQDLQATTVLGTALKEKIVTDFNAGTLTGVYDTMYPLIEKMVIWQAYRYGLPMLLYRVSNGKITKGSTVDSAPIELDELGALQREQDGKVTHYTNLLKAYLRDNRESITEFDDTTEWYIQENLDNNYSSMGTTYSDNRKYSDF